MKATDPRDAGYKKAARFLMLLGKDEAAQVMKHLSEEEASGISREIALLSRLDTREAEKVLEEFGYLWKTKDLVARGGLEKARDILYAAFGEEKGGIILERIEARTAPHPFAFLMDLDIEQVRLLLKNESAPVIAAILPHLNPGLAASIVTSLKEAMQTAVVARIARLEKIDPEVLRRTEGALKEKIRAQGEISTQEIDGQAALVEILRHMAPANEQAILEDLKLEDRSLALAIEKKLFTMDVLLLLSDRDLQALLRDYSDQELGLIIKGLNEQQLARLESNVTSRRWSIIQEENRAWGEVRRSEVNKAIQEFLDYVRVQQEKGEIRIIRGDSSILL
jgi:flagellar motor switch protein FliG